MSVISKSQAEFMAEARTLIDNAIGLSELSPELASYRYDAERLAQGKKLWEDVNALFTRHSIDKGGKEASTAELGRARERANAAYIKSLKVARLTFASDEEAAAALQLYGPRKQTVSGWLLQASNFYSTLAAKPSLVERLGFYGFSREKLESETALVEEVRARYEAKSVGSGNAQDSTATRDDKMRELDDWVAAFKTICRIAFYEKPAYLEKLGIVVLNTKRQAKKGVAEETVTAAS